MRVYKIRVYGADWRKIREEFIKAEDRQQAELKEEMIADECINNGCQVNGTSLERVR